MKQEFIFEGKTFDEAINVGLAQLNMERDDVEIEIVEAATKGFLGFGGSNAKIKITCDIKEQDSPEFFLGTLFEKMNVNIAVKSCNEIEEGNNKNVEIKIEGEEAGIIIGRHGETLDAVQYLCNLVANKDKNSRVRVTLDSEDYRSKRESSLVGLAKKTAMRVIKMRRSVTLEPMNANERRIIHASLQDFRGVSTHSTGDEPHRRVVIAYGKQRTSFDSGNNSKVNAEKTVVTEINKNTDDDSE